jgi:hypothetical protein
VLGFEDKSGSFNLLEKSFLYLVFRFFWCFVFGLREKINKRDLVKIEEYF